jgi:hypothetical protein
LPHTSRQDFSKKHGFNAWAIASAPDLTTDYLETREFYQDRASREEANAY